MAKSHATVATTLNLSQVFLIFCTMDLNEYAVLRVKRHIGEFVYNFGGLPSKLHESRKDEFRRYWVGIVVHI